MEENITKEENEVSEKSRLVATILVWLLGTWGVHLFYCGKIGRGILRLVIISLAFLSYTIGWGMTSFGDFIEFGSSLEGVVFLCAAGIIFIVIQIISFVQAIKITIGSYKDAKGKLITNWGI